MDNPRGRIQTLVRAASGTRAVVAIDAQAACPRCRAGKGCGAGLFGAGNRPQRLEAAVATGLRVAEGDLVELALAPRNLLRAALIVYGSPLAGAVVASALAYWLAPGDASAAVAALAGLAAGLGVGRWRLSRDSCLSRLLPTVNKRLPGPRTAG